MQVKKNQPMDVLRFPHPVLEANKLKRKSIREVSVMGKSYVLYRDKEGKAIAVPSACPHRGAKLSKGTVNNNGELVCAYHAWRINGNGKVTNPSVPERSCEIHVMKTWEKYGFIWIANHDVSDEAFPEFLKPGYELIGNFTTHFNAPLKVVLDNFGEIEHAFKVHTFIGPNEKILDSVNFTVKIEEEETKAFLGCKYRPQPFFFGWFFGYKKGDLYHNDWVVKFKPVHGSYQNYWTDQTEKIKRPVSFIVTTFMVPLNEKEVSLKVFLQMSIRNRFLRMISPILKLSAYTITRYEIWADAQIAKFAPEKPDDGSNWRLTYLDKQIMPNRKLLDKLYFGIKEKEVLAEKEEEMVH